MPNRCKLQSLLAVSVTVPAYTKIENLIKWRTDLQNKTPKFIEMVEKLGSGYAPNIWVLCPLVLFSASSTVEVYWT